MLMSDGAVHFDGQRARKTYQVEEVQVPGCFFMERGFPPIFINKTVGYLQPPQHKYLDVVANF